MSTSSSARTGSSGQPRRRRGPRTGRRGPGTPRVDRAALARRAEARRAVVVPPITYPEELPVSARREEIAAAVRDHQVVVVSGETGSGKTTQLPKILLDLGRGRDGQIGHTQPRRIAARSVAERISEELTGSGDALGSVVGYQVRFTDQSSEDTLVKVMTDGILLAQIQRDPMLLAYDTLVIDEAHERSLNIDFILGYLTRLLPRRPDLKVVITSATIDSARFARHFGTPPSDEHPDGVPAPVVEVTGRTYPVEIRYRPLTLDPTPTPDADREPPDEDTAKWSENRRDRSTGSDQGARSLHSAASGAVTRGEERDLMTAICDAVDELAAEGPGDVLVFLSGEREIRDAEDALRGRLGPRVTDPHHPQPVELLPLYSRLSAAEQHRVFTPSRGRRVVLATNVAETSLTVPGIRYVVDPGTARISRWSKATKVQRLPIEPISQASANQRSGRCGRVADGIAIRLYSEADFASRPRFTEPEILRTSLASVILQMISVGVVQSPDDVARFPFVDPPDVRAIRDGVQLLTELGALTTDPTPTELSERGGPRGSRGSDTSTDPGTVSERGEAQDSPRSDNSRGARAAQGRVRLTEVGRALALLPIDPRLARMVVEGGRRDVAREVVIIAAALSIQDPRERPAEQRDEADRMHARFADPTSDFLTYLNLWHYVRDQQRALSGSAFRRMCRAEHLNYLRLREWQDVVTQLRELAKPLGIVVRPPARVGPSNLSERGEAQGPPGSDKSRRSADGAGAGGGEEYRLAWDADRIHQSVLAGLLSHIGMQQVTEVRARGGKPDRGGPPQTRLRRNEYLGARGTRFAIFPGSPMARRPPAWVVAGELVETSRLWARDVARIQPEWAEELGAHLVRRSYSEPRWSAKRGAAVADEKVTLYGVPVVTGRRVLWAKVDPEHARELFIRHALVQGEWTTHHEFFHRNRELLAEAEQVEHRARRRDLVVDDDVLVDFYDQRLPADVVSARHFDRWWKSARREQPDLLTFTLDMLVADDAHLDEQRFPTTWPQGDLALALTYQFDPGSQADGVTVHVPVQVLARVRPEGFDWLVPGMLEDLVVATIRSLPKPVRVQLVPAPDVARDVVAWLDAHAASWADTVRAADAAPSFREMFARAVRELRGVVVPDEAFDPERLPSHLRVTFRVHEERRGGVVVLDEGPDLLALQRRLADRSQDAVRTAVRDAVRQALAERAATTDLSERGEARGSRRSDTSTMGAHLSERGESRDSRGSDRSVGVVEREALTAWPDLPDGRIPDVVTTRTGGLEVRAYPALVVDDGAAARDGRRGGPRPVALRVLADGALQAATHRRGVVELLLTELALPTARVTSRWPAPRTLAMAASPYPSTEALVTDLQRAAVDALATELGPADGAVRDRVTYERLRTAVRDRLEDRVEAVAARTADVLVAFREADATLRATTSLALLDTVTDVRGQLAALVHDGFVTEAGAERLPHLVRYLRAARHRLEKAAEDPRRDASHAWQVREVADEHAAAVEVARTQPPDAARDARLTEARWLLEELRVSLFAQQLGTARPVSAKRVRALLTG